VPVPTINFTTGPSTLPDIGVFSYNGCVFSPLFETKVSGTAVKDNANRTVKYMEYDIAVDGYVTLSAGSNSISDTMATLRKLLSAQGGTFTYQGRGFDLVVGPQSTVGDVAWGPVPEILEFQPLGAGKSAKVVWKVKVRVVEVNQQSLHEGSLLQFNYETVVTYDEDGYSSLSVKGTMEIPLKRFPLQTSRDISHTVDNFRWKLDTKIFIGIDLSRFRVVRRNYQVSRDKRTMEFDVAVEEKPYMDLPPDCTISRGSYSVRPAKAGMGLCNWLCTLRATYIVRADRPRRVAWFAFLALLRLRMSQARFGVIPQAIGGDHNQSRLQTASSIGRGAILGLSPLTYWASILNNQSRSIAETNRALLMDFSIDEGIYLDSKTTTFSATWRIVTLFSHILLASGLWKKVPEEDENGQNLWAISMRNVSGSQSWLPNPVDQALDIIVDFAGGQ